MTAIATETYAVATAFEAAGRISDLLAEIEDAAADVTDSDLSIALTLTRIHLTHLGERLAQLVQLDRAAGVGA